MSSGTAPSVTGKTVEKLETVVIRFAGDSGDGMQVTGNQFTNTTAVLGNDLATLPDYPAEIRAPAGTLPGVSGFQLNFSSLDVHTPGDTPDVLVAMNPAALKLNLPELRPRGVIIVNTDSFQKADLRKAGYQTNPLEDQSLEGYRLFQVPLTTLTRKALEGLEISTRAGDRSKNQFVLGIMYWLYGRPMDNTLKWYDTKFSKDPIVREANTRALKAGFNFAETTEIFQTSYEVPPAELEPGRYRNITGNSALSLGLVVAAQKARRPLFLGSYPITPASDILHELSRYKNYDVFTFQAEDEIAGICSSIGAAFGGALAITTTSGPGVALKGEALGLATMVELPLVVVNIQRGGPSTGLPTKTEQADLFQALFGRNSESPIPVIAPQTPSDCFQAAVEAARAALDYMVPVLVLSDGYLANGAEPWRLPDVDAIPEIEVEFAKDPETYQPYVRDPETLARQWAIPGTPGLEHRLGGLEKDALSGNVSYDPLNHEKMVRVRAEKVERVAAMVPDAAPDGEPNGDLLIVGWGSTYGAITAAVRKKRSQGVQVSHLHLRWLNPLPRNLGEVLGRYRQILVPELNLGQLRWLLRAKYLVDVVGLNKIQGRPFSEGEITAKIDQLLETH